MSDEMKQLEEQLREAAIRDAPERAKRYLEVKPLEVVPATHFADVSAECARLHRDAHFYGSIALCQAVGEAIVRHIRGRAGVPPAELEAVVRTLSERQVIPDDVRDNLLELWIRRNDYHHLNPSIATDRDELETLSRRKNQLLKSIEAEMFGWSVGEGGRLVLKYPHLWDVTGETTSAFLRFESPR